jgi:hypothetical protein
VDQAASPTVVPEQKRYHERELHPLMVWFANQHFGAHCRTIKHEISVKKGPKHNEWLHPDIVAFSLMTHGWEPPVVNLAQASGSIAAKLYSFEMKIEIGFSTLREYFFQTVSNSSWAHEGYLVAVSIDEDQEFRDELARLSQGFGIGVIQLNLREPLDSEIILPARERDEIDWETVNRIAEVNEDFMKFITDVVNSVKINQESVQNFEPVPKDDDVARIARDLLK